LLYIIEGTGLKWHKSKLKGGNLMNIVCVTACSTGIAHTYIAKEKLVNAAKALGHNVKVETQGTIGAEDVITPEEVKKADVVIIAADIEISGRDRFRGKKIVEVPIKMVVKSPEALIKKVQEKLGF
jgi:fructose PTS system EIIB component